MMKLFSSNAANAPMDVSQPPLATPEGGGSAAPTDVSQMPHRAGVGFRRRKMNIEGKINARRSYELPQMSMPRQMPMPMQMPREEIDTRPEQNIYAPIRQPNIAENTERTRMEDLARATQIDRELQSRRGKTYPKVWNKEKLDGGKSTRKLISKNRKYSRRK
jgi:hypothetical protein